MPTNLLKVGGLTLFVVLVTVIGAIASLIGCAAWKQRQFAALEDTRDLPARIEALAGTYLESRPRAALVVGVHQRGRDWVGGFGTVETSTEGRKPDGTTIFEIGSITKVFTGLVLANAVNRGQVQLEDPLSAVLSAAVEGASEPVRRITLRQLATHTAGLPRLPADFWDQAGTNRANPYAGYLTAELFAGLPNLELKREPGSGYEYSNYGAAILGQVLAARLDQTYPELLQKTVLDPLAMHDTIMSVPEEKQGRLVGGYTPKGEPTPNWDFDAFAPAGGLRSTATDMLKFVRAALQPGEDPLGKALRLSMQVHSDVSRQKVGLGWHQLSTIEGLTVWWHNGGTGGYVSFLGIDSEHQTGVIVLANYGDALAGKFDVDKIGVNVLTLAAKVMLE